MLSNARKDNLKRKNEVKVERFKRINFELYLEDLKSWMNASQMILRLEPYAKFSQKNWISF